MEIQPFFSYISNRTSCQKNRQTPISSNFMGFQNTDKRQNILDGTNDILNALLVEKSNKQIIRPNNKDLLYLQNEINSKTLNLWANYKLLMHHCIKEASKNLIDLENCTKKLRNIESRCDLLKGILDIFKNGNRHINITKYFAKFNNEHVKEMQAIIKNQTTSAQNNDHPQHILANAIHQFTQRQEEEYTVNINLRMTI